VKIVRRSNAGKGVMAKAGAIVAISSPRLRQ